MGHFFILNYYFTFVIWVYVNFSTTYFLDKNNKISSKSS
ncbi:hypothetical protein B4099_1028 [Heyndrickxia coagulans]|uniref:Uncharacterized protein n=1 Tax=Heyndrickxia coagulans TaxID=1398 RepID=A0A150KDU0_HEYCO|nr:hypothetical protein B4099_1028 [Heyndrickxia coagulans]